MAQDYTNSKRGLADVFPETAVDTPFHRLEPLITPELLRTRHLFGIPLISAIADPITGKKQPMTEAILKDYIIGAVTDAEADTAVDIFPIQHNEKYPFDRSEYLSFGFFRTLHRPVYSLDGLFVTPANNVDVFQVPLDWTETSYLATGQINLIPIGIALNGSVYGGGVVTGVGAGAAAFLAILANQNWIPAFWRIVYTTGFPDGMIPRYVNDLIGVIAAIKILSSLAATAAHAQSSSIGADGLSQSVSTPGPQKYEVRIAKLEEERKKKIKVVRKMFGFGVAFSGNV